MFRLGDDDIESPYTKILDTFDYHYLPIQLYLEPAFSFPLMSVTAYGKNACSL